MRHLRIQGLCLVAIFAVAAATAGTAAAASPEWGQCYAKEGGKYTNANCTTKGRGGSFEWRKGAHIAEKQFSGEGGTGVLSGSYIFCEPGAKRTPTCGEGKEEFTLPVSVECTSETNTGEASGKDDITNVVVKFKGCTSLGTACSNTVNEGEINVNPLKGVLGFINKSKDEVGVLLQPKAKNGEFAQFVCSGHVAAVVGVGSKKEGYAYPPKGGSDGIISPITPVNQMTDAFTQVFTVNEALENVPNKFENKSIDVLESYIYNAGDPEESSMWSKAGETITNVNTPAEEVEIKS